MQREGEVAFRRMQGPAASVAASAVMRTPFSRMLSGPVPGRAWRPSRRWNSRLNLRGRNAILNGFDDSGIDRDASVPAGWLGVIRPKRTRTEETAARGSSAVWACAGCRNKIDVQIPSNNTEMASFRRMARLSS